jgi:hypothetical protein
MSSIRTGELIESPKSLGSCQYQALLECMQRTGNNEELCQREIQEFQQSCRPKPSLDSAKEANSKSVKLD